MKLGVRKPNIKKRVRARTTGKAKRAVKSAINPLYGEKGTGLINDPKKPVYNKIYNKTTMSVDDFIEDATYGYEDDGIELFKVNEKRVQDIENGTYKRKPIGKYFLIVFGVICLLNSFAIGKINPATIVLGIICLAIAFRDKIIAFRSKNKNAE